MFELFKKRNFSEYISDTITFFKTFGKHYFKNYFIINGIFLMILVVLLYFVSKVYMEFIFSLSSPNNGVNKGSYIVDYFNNNTILFITTVILFLLLTIFISMISYAYPVIYLQYIEKTNATEFTSNDIIKALKENISRLIIFFLGLLFIITPLMIVVITINVLLIFIIIGLPLFFIVIPGFMSWIALSFYEFMSKKIGFFEALGNGFKLMRLRFWDTIGTTLVMAFLIQIIQGIITLIPYIIGIVILFTTGQSMPDSGAQAGDFSGFTILFSIIMVVSIILSYTFQNFQFINQGLIYYSLREDSENNTSKSQIDLIGTDSE
jgi:hypothetical protein